MRASVNLPLLSIPSECHTRLTDQLQERGNERIWTIAPAFEGVRGCVCLCVFVFECGPYFLRHSVRLHGSTSWSVHGRETGNRAFTPEALPHCERLCRAEEVVCVCV